MSLKIWTYPQNPRAFKGMIAAKYNGVDVAEEAVEMGKTNKTPEFLQMNPMGKVPVLETPEGAVWESNAIARYCARLNGNQAKLFGRSAIEEAQVEQWLDWVRGEVEVPGAVWLYPIFGIIEENPQATKLAIEDVKKAMDTLDLHLKTRTFLVGHRLTLADIVVSQTLTPFYKMVFDAGFRKKYTNVNRWFNTCVNQKTFIAVAGEVALCQKAQVAKAVVKAEAPKEAPKEAAKPEAAPAKKGNPLDSLPKSSFDLEEWKRMYSNADDTRKILGWFWDNVDLEGYSLWISEYKYADENDVLFKTCNLVTGFCQRMETRKVHRYGFGSIGLFGETQTEITGAWVFRGTSLPDIVKEVPDYDSHTFTQVDVNDAAQKKMFEDLFCWEGDFAGKTKKFQQGKNFK
mmetsp:Transcript_2876/g.3356  ORF Transcript_2876/g.3356 Transcript_2876/m.3356 type:complete len:402 (+) Transcript_2876:22-1227(+)